MKCPTCNKLITKKTPILECSRCQKKVHATTVCTGLSSKQMAALRAAENLEWTCNDCSLNSSRRKSFVTIDCEEEDYEEEHLASENPDVKKFLMSMKKEVSNIISNEMRSFGNSVQYCAEKVDEFAETIQAMTDRFKDQDKKILHLENKNKNLELRIECTEQRCNELEQLLLGDHIEIAGIPETCDVELPKLVETVAVKLSALKEDIVSVKRLPARRGGPGAVLVKVRRETTRQQLMKAARDTLILARDVLPSLTGAAANEKIYVRDALTTHNKTLLWQAKQDLKGIYKYIWSRDGFVLVRKDEKAKVIKIRSKVDIEFLMSKK